eukprot:9663315-Alexandrium_andersonii.AAC.1
MVAPTPVACSRSLSVDRSPPGTLTPFALLHAQQASASMRSTRSPCLPCCLSLAMARWSPSGFAWSSCGQFLPSIQSAGRALPRSVSIRRSSASS